MSLSLMNRELSWVEFNQRVLNEAFRKELPLLERLKFLAISASNLDEFFQVRMGGLLMLKLAGINQADASGLTPKRNLALLKERVSLLIKSQYELYADSLLPELKMAGIHLLKYEELSVAQKAQLSAIFDDQIYPLLTPLSVDSNDRPMILPALQVVLACRLSDPESGSMRHVFLPIPESLGRRVTMTDRLGGCSFLWIEEVVSVYAHRIFPGESLESFAVFRVTRNGDIVVRDEESMDLADEMEDMITARRFSDVVRLELMSDVCDELRKVIMRVTRALSSDVFFAKGPVGLSSLMELAMLPGFDHLRDPEWVGQHSADMVPGVSMFDTISASDLMLYHPYESFEPVIRLLEEAAIDVDVLAIKQVLYRTAKKSRIIDALIRAAENGKQVTVLVELKARFDEARNLDRADELQRAGVQIVYGVKGLKTHAKICMIVRREAGHLRRYVHLGTGNYNEATSRLYTDISYFTCKSDYGNDASSFFNAVTGRSKLLKFQRLIPAPTALKPTILNLIAGETERARQGFTAKIIAKVNSLQDPQIIEALELAAKAGVEIKLNVRGICCLKPDLHAQGAVINVISVIDRYLEHARIFYFHQGGDPKVYISSADWMTRNLEKRVELMIPIDEERHKRRLLKILETFFKDNVQASRIKRDGTSERVTRKKGEKAFRAQAYFYEQAKEALKAREHERAMTFEPHIPAQ